MKSDKNGASSFTSNRARIMQTVPLHERSSCYRLGLIFLKDSCELLRRPHWFKLTGIQKADHFKNVINGHFLGFLKNRKQNWITACAKRNINLDPDNLAIVSFTTEDLMNYYKDPVNVEFEKSYSFIKAMNKCFVAIDLKTSLFAKAICYHSPKYSYTSKGLFKKALERNLEENETFDSRYKIYKISEQFIIRAIQRKL